MRTTRESRIRLSSSYAGNKVSGYPISSRLLSAFWVIQAVATVAEPLTSDPNTAAIALTWRDLLLTTARDMARTDERTVSAGPLPIKRETARSCTMRVPLPMALLFMMAF